jgi:hypothetical protein
MVVNLAHVGSSTHTLGLFLCFGGFLFLEEVQYIEKPQKKLYLNHQNLNLLEKLSVKSCD